MTKARQEILNLLSDSKIALSAKEIGNLTSSNRATVFRSLSVFVKSGLVREVHHPDKITRYEISSDHHHHLICNSCGAVSDFKIEEEELIKKIASESNFQVKNHLLDIYGLCYACQL